MYFHNLIIQGAFHKHPASWIGKAKGGGGVARERTGGKIKDIGKGRGGYRTLEGGGGGTMAEG